MGMNSMNINSVDIKRMDIKFSGYRLEDCQRFLFKIFRNAFDIQLLTENFFELFAGVT